VYISKMPWSCPQCTLDNIDEARVCLACGTAKPLPPRPASPPSPHFNGRAFMAARIGQKVKNPPGWNCTKCTLLNPSDAATCGACESWRCPSCTLVNERGASACGACGQPKPAAKGGSLAKRRKTKRRKYTKRRRACQTRRIKKQNR
jgi:hypothetical protein